MRFCLKDKTMEDILADKNVSSLLIFERKNTDIVIGVPHHAPAGKSELLCPNHRNSDENAGYLGKYIAEKLNCCCIIACNYHLDVNKCLCSDYGVHIARWCPKYLIEIHGHGSDSAKFDIEISSGSAKNNKYSQKLEKLLCEKWVDDDILSHVSISGDYGAIKLKASGSATIIDSRWIAFHIELPPELRFEKGRKSGEPPQIGYKFCDYLIESLKEMSLV